MSHEELHALLAEDGDDAPAELNDDERWLFRHVGALAALLRRQAELYPRMLARWEREGPSEELRSAALDAAGLAAALLQAARRRPGVLIAAGEPPVSLTLPLGLLDQLFYSFTLLTSPSADERTEAMLTAAELDELMGDPELRDWLARISVAGG